MRWSDIPVRPSDTTLRQFTAVGVLLVAGLAYWLGFDPDDRALALCLLGGGCLWGILGLLYPQALRPVFVGWLCLTFPLGWAISHLVLALLFFGVFTPVGCFFRLIGRDALARRRRADAATYWQDKSGPADLQSYFRQS
jgi:hypothetical protein